MAHCYYHALSSVRKWGGAVDDYLPLHQWFDQSKAILADPRHRALRHHAEGIFMLESLFGATIVNADGRTVPVRLVGEQHVREDLGFIPSFADWARLIAPEAWMLRGNPLDEPARGAAGNAGAAGDEVFVRSRAGDDQPVRIAI
ncbi:hypothetical protein G432_14890 [Sphingomonas sp. MM-1]|uniref:DUF6915 family protein n=1 Tax=Sphingomonas sp. MM-1 TaxID=745310 RepID=UPI0002C09BC4|nr:hypothetical protein [Sphingomonas sp. MM-1]AGH50695.1 hypothetical protein G432_14890 [Sphingomonas sp. MM-1]